MIDLGPLKWDIFETLLVKEWVGGGGGGGGGRCYYVFI